MKINPVLLVIDMQNGFCGVGGSFNQFGFNIKPYQAIIPKLKQVINYMRIENIPVYYSKAIREYSGIDLIDKVHRIIPESRRERLEKMHLCIRDTWDSDIIDELKPMLDDYIVEKRRDSVFQDTEFDLWLKAFRTDTIIFTGIDTYICVESTVRDAFNKGYDVIVLKDCVASRTPRHHESTIEEIADAYGLVINSDEFFRMIESKEFIISGIDNSQ